MDETDLVLSMLLLQNSRLSYRELADRLGLSVNAVHKRIRTLVEQGVIRAFTAKISIDMLKAVPLVVFGRSEAQSFEAAEKLREHGFTYWLGVAGGNYLYLGVYLRNIAELESYVDFIRKEAKMPDPTVGIEPDVSAFQSPPASREATLYPLDYQIIYALHKNSRKLISKVAEELGVSARTVRRRLSRLIREGLIELSIEWYPDASNDVMTIFHLQLKASADKNKAVSLLMEKYSPYTIFFWSFSNLPNQLVGVVWTNTMKQLRDIQRSIRSEGIFESVIPNILYTGYIFDTWRDKLVQEKGVPPHQEAAKK
jgi:DNA-binding Lrp family transcriptional regulator